MQQDSRVPEDLIEKTSSNSDIVPDVTRPGRKIRAPRTLI